MSSALAIAGVTQVLRDLLNDGMVNHDVSATVGTNVNVSVVPPDRVFGGGGPETTQLNLFLYHVTPNTGWRNEGLPSRDESGRSRLTNPPLALDLHYLLSAFSGGDLHAEIVLGYGMQLLHENPVLTRGAIRKALRPSPDVGTNLPTALRALEDSGLEDQLELIKITPEYLNTEELSKLWTATQSHFRPTAAYRATVVLIQSKEPTPGALPVLTRNIGARPSLDPPYPTLTRITLADGQPVARLGVAVTFEGYALAGTNRRIHLVNERYEIDELLAGTVDGPLQLTLPVARTNDFPCGIYRASALVTGSDGIERESSPLPMTVAPDLVGLPPGPIPLVGGGAAVTVGFTPALRAGQTSSLLLGDRAFAPTAPVAYLATTLDFALAGLTAGSYLARLRIDGIESPIIDRTSSPPTFLPRVLQFA